MRAGRPAHHRSLDEPTAGAPIAVEDYFYCTGLRDLAPPFCDWEVVGWARIRGNDLARGSRGNNGERPGGGLDLRESRARYSHPLIDCLAQKHPAGGRNAGCHVPQRKVFLCWGSWQLKKRGGRGGGGGERKRVRVKSGYLLISSDGSSSSNSRGDKEKIVYRAAYVEIIPVFRSASASPQTQREKKQKGGRALLGGKNDDDNITGMGLQVSDSPDSEDYMRYGLLGCNVQVGSDPTEFIIHTQSDEPLRAKAASVRSRIGWVQTIGACSAPVSVIKKVYRHLAVEPLEALEQELEDLNFVIAAEGRMKDDPVSPTRIDVFNKQIEVLSELLANHIKKKEDQSNRKHTLQLIEWESAGGDEWPTAEHHQNDGGGSGDGSSAPIRKSTWLRGVAVTGVSASRVNLRIVTFYSMQAVAPSDKNNAAKLVRFTKRFSQFIEMHAEVQKWYRKKFPSIELPMPPPKNSMAVFSKRKNTFLNERKLKLERYINAMACVAHMKNCEPFLEFLNMDGSA
mmetsp:Transcript_23454/g.32805  ORF Transcript_23454/g.32805 Transcript_23454/m.32805 type:complete len:512 (+) Transcript_23454:161-1696(+)